jgi:glycosyltransferase involved in cell wall biosynthesis
VKSNKVAIFFFEGYISAAPTILNLCSFFYDNKIDVTLFTRKINDKYIKDNSKYSFSIEYIDSDYPFVSRIILSIITRLFKKKNRKKYNSLVYTFNSFLFFKNAKHKKFKTSIFNRIIGVDTIGLLAADRFNSNHNPLIYLSLEINYLFNNSNIYTKWVKNEERKIHSRCDYTIIQDKVRLQFLCIENNLDFHKIRFLLLPNSPRPNFTFNCFDNNYFKKKYSLKQSDFIVLSAGMISDEVHSYEVVQSLLNLNDNIFLILHERKSLDLKTDIYLNSLLALNARNLLLSLEPVEYRNIDFIFASADIGLAIYNSKYGINYSNILYASGKISHYLKFGKPIIVNDLPGMLEFINETQCGIIVNDLSDIHSAVLEIKNNYLWYSKNAYKAYCSHFNFDKYCKDIISNIFDI